MKRLGILIALITLLSSCAITPIYTNFYVIPEVRNMYASSISVLKDKKNVVGSGTIIYNKRNKRMVVITAAHVVREQYKKNPECIINISYRKEDIRKMKVFKYSDHFDLAVLISTTKEVKDGPYAKLAATHGKIGDKVWLIGAPLGEKNTVTEGIISNRVENKGKMLYRTTAAGFFGNSGGGLFNEEGELLGVAHILSFFRANIFVIMPVPGGVHAVSVETIREFFKK
jgi:S1-C subfamily serine protease